MSHSSAPQSQFRLLNCEVVYTNPEEDRKCHFFTLIEDKGHFNSILFFTMFLLFGHF
jgi:hypothetical protein